MQRRKREREKKKKKKGDERFEERNWNAKQHDRTSGVESDEMDRSRGKDAARKIWKDSRNPHKSRTWKKVKATAELKKLGDERHEKLREEQETERGGYGQSIADKTY